MKPNYRMAKVSDLKPHPGNPRKHSEAELKALSQSVKRFGFTCPIVVQKSTGLVLAGHARLEVLQKQGTAEAPVIELDVNDKDAVAYMIADNQLTILGAWDFPMLEELVTYLKAEDYDGMDFINDLGLPEFEAIEVTGLVDPDEVPDVPVKPITNLGDLWMLGEHRLLCGNCTDAASVVMLMNGKRADMVLSDPPYGVSYVGKTKNALTIESDDLEENQLAQLILSAFNHAQNNCRPGSYWYATVPPGPLHLLYALDWKNRGILRQILVWAKDSMVLGHSEYHYQHEPILFGWIPGNRHKNEDRTRTTIWECARPKASREHPTMKPVDLWTRAINDGSRAGEIIYDPFLGSGTTIIAAEKTGRICYGMEISPAYCDVIIKRWETFTGEKATLEKT